MSMAGKKYKVEIPEDLKKTVGVNFKVSPKTMEGVHRYASANGISLAEACRIALDRLGREVKSSQN